MHTVENGRSSSGKLHHFPAKCNDELQETKGVIIKKYKIGNFDTKQLCKSLMLSLALQGSSAQLPAAWGKGAPDFLPLFAMCSSLHLVVVTQLTGIYIWTHLTSQKPSMLPHLRKSGSRHRRERCSMKFSHRNTHTKD